MEPQLYRPYGTGTSLYNYTVEPQLYRPYGTGTSLYNIKWNLSYTDPMGLALVCIIYSGTSVIWTPWDWHLYTVETLLYGPYETGISLYNVQ